jgi:phosphate-selective porin OprO/OprP
MTKTLWLASTAIVAAAMIAVPAQAGGKSASDTRDQEIQELKARLDRLEREAEDEKIASGARISKIEEHQATQPLWTFNDSRPTITSTDGKYSMSIRGRFMFDVASFEQDSADFDDGYRLGGDCNLSNVLCDQGSGAVFRRVRLGVEGRFFKDFIYEMRFDFGGSGSESAGTVNIMRVGYTGIPGLRVHVGAIQPIITLYDATSSADLTTMERAGIITTLVGNFGGDNARRGLEATYQKSNFLWKGDNFVISSAYTGERIGSDHTGIPGNDESTHWLGRLAYRLWSDGVSNIQIGGSYSQVLNDDDGAMTITERPEIRVGGGQFVSTGSIATEGGSTASGFEFGANFKNFYLAAEYYQFDIDRAGGLPDPDFSGYYVEGEWIFTGEAKGYTAAGTNNNVGVFKSPKVASPWSLGGGTGAWSLHGRYSVLDLNFNEGVAGSPLPAGGIRGGEQTITNVGLTWYLNSNLKIMGEYAMVDIDRINSAGAGNVCTAATTQCLSLDAEFDILQGRFMFTF